MNNYVYYTLSDGTSTVHNRVSRCTASPPDGSGKVVVAPGSELPILDLFSLGAANYNGGAIHLSADGKPHMAVGENISRKPLVTE